MKSQNKNIPDNLLELELLNKGYSCIVGIDEVGRGCWAGPVYLGAVVYRLDSEIIPDVNDSKLLSAKKREFIYTKIAKNTQYHVEVGSVEMINQIGIGKSITKLVENVIEKFNNLSPYYLIDGQFSRDFGPNTRQIIKGDMKHYSIAAASIMAKVERDNLMVILDQKYPGWQFAKHKGYGTTSHIEALDKLGVSVVHRLNYKPIMAYLDVSKQKTNR